MYRKTAHAANRAEHKRAITDLLELPPRHFVSVINREPMEMRGEIVRGLDSLLQAAAWAHAYADARYGTGCGDRGHEAAIKAANRMLTKVRKAIGYTYPDRAAIVV